MDIQLIFCDFFCLKCNTSNVFFTILKQFCENSNVFMSKFISVFNKNRQIWNKLNALAIEFEF